MISVMSFELLTNRIECLFDGINTWIVLDRGHPTYCNTYQGASQKMDEAIEELMEIFLANSGMR